ncbi:MAG: GNAT family N-acetyltransferase [Chloroflexota bacterium]
MVTQTDIGVRFAEKTDLPQLTNMLHFETYVHRHLDWRPPLEWLGHSPFLILEDSGKITAALACPPDPPGVAWIRMFATTGTLTSAEAWKMFWPKINDYFADDENISVAAIPIQKWFEQLLINQGFTQSHDVVMMVCNSLAKDIPAAQNNVLLRPMTAEDLETVAKVDSSAFDRLWHNSFDSLQLAFSQAALATVAELDSKIVGYQISTPSPSGIHLARLAVLPETQGNGIGYAIVSNLLSDFGKNGGESVSVNTQHDNSASLALYQKAGFKPTGESYPIFQYKLNE